MYVVGNGARTSLGLHASPSAAALRAAISCVREHPYMLDRFGNPVLGGIDNQLDPRLMGPGRLLALAETALREACAPLSSTVRPHLRLPVYLGLPELRPGFTKRDANAVRTGLARFEGLPTELQEVSVITQGHAAGLTALAMATEQMERGAFEACIVGGLESYFQPETLGWLEENRQLANADSRSCFVPGEGAGFCLLAAEPVSKRLRLSPLARVRAVSTGNETMRIKSGEVCLGEGLTKTVQASITSLPTGETINEVICDINGERYRAEEWGFVCLRLSRNFDNPAAYLSPADCWGDTGAASVPLFAMLACEAAARGYSKGPRVLLWASSEGGLRGAAVLETSWRL